MLWSTCASALIHLVVLTLLFYAVAHVIVSRGKKEVVMQTTLVRIEKNVAPKHAAARRIRRVVRHEAAPAKTPPHELARIVASIHVPHEPPHKQTIPSKIERDEAGFAREVARLNAQNDPHAIPTIDPSGQESRTKSYSFAVPSSLRGQDEGNGIITPVRAWHEGGLDCYYGRYEFTYPDGATEEGNIVWPFCFDPGSDPFKEPPHPIPFPLPVAGFKLPADAQMPPIEKSVYQQWAAHNGGGSMP
jgi:hypothetical protein